MGLIDSIKQSFGYGDTKPAGDKRPVKKGTSIDINDKVEINQGGELPTSDVIARFKGKPQVKPGDVIKNEKPLSPKDMQKRIEETLHRMTLIAQAFGSDFKMGVQAGKNWAYHFESNTITYPPSDLVESKPGYALGVILHELSHRKYSRWLVEPKFSQNEPFLFLNNAVEDPRVNNITTSRFAGAKDFFKKVYDKDLFSEDFGSEMSDKMKKNLIKQGLSPKQADEVTSKMTGKVPRYVQFGLGVIYDWYTDGKMDPRIKDPKVQEAVKKAAPHFRKAFGLKRDVMKKDLTNGEVNTQAQEAYDIVRDNVWPIYQELVKLDKQEMAQNIQQNQQGNQGQQGQQGQAGGSGSPQQAGNNQQAGGQGSGSPQQAGGQGSGGGSPQQAGNNQQAGGQGSGGAGKPQDASKPGEDQKPGSGDAGGKKLTPEQIKEIAEKVIEGIAGDLNGEKLEEKDTSGRRENRPGNSGKPGQAGNNQQGNQAGNNQQAGGNQGQQAGDQGSQGSDANKPGDANQNQQSGQSGDSGQGGSGGSSSQIDQSTLEELLQKKMELEANKDSMMSRYDDLVYDTADGSRALSGELANFIKKNERPRYSPQRYKTGKKLDLRAAMRSEVQYQATGKFDPNIWQRKNMPKKRDHSFVFVMDESGSMRGNEKWDNALKGLVMCQEALDDLEIDYGVIGFSDSAEIHKEFSDKPNDDQKNTEINSIENSKSGGTNDADAVSTALEMIRLRPGVKTIIVMTDGDGKKDEMKQLIRQADEAGVSIIGIGIGQDTESVAEVYRLNDAGADPNLVNEEDRRFVRVDDVNDLPYELSEVLRNRIEGAYED